MPPLSIPDEPDTPKARSNSGASGADLWVRALIPAAVALIFIAVLIGETSSTEFDLQITAPRTALPGEEIPLRAWLFDLRGSVPELADEVVVVRLRDLEGNFVGEPVELFHRGPYGSEGAITLPEERGQLELFAEAQVGEDERAFVSRRIHVGDAEPSGRRGRLATDLQRYALGPVQGESQRLDARIEGGDCSPPWPCSLWVWVGEPAATVSLVEPRGLDVAMAPPSCESHEATSKLVWCHLRATNNEASVDVVASREGVEVARRTLTLPVGLAVPEIRVESRLLSTFRYQVARRYDEPGPVLVDFYYEDRWRSTRTVDPHELVEPELFTFEPRSAGLWRAQARTDGFGNDHVAVRSFTPNGLRLIAQRSRDAGYDDPAAELVLAGRAAELSEDPERIASFLLAFDEMELLIPPRATSGAAQVNAGLHDVHQHRRWGAAILIFVAGFFVAVVVWRRGMRASLQARALLSVEGEPAEPRTAWSVIGAALFVIAVFSAVAILVVSRGCL